MIRQRGVHLHEVVRHNDGGYCFLEDCGNRWGDVIGASFVGGS